MRLIGHDHFPIKMCFDRDHGKEIISCVRLGRQSQNSE
jgi:hypothetical protein